MADLFNKKGLEQDSGRISERWGQDGSKLINVFDSSVGGANTMYTVTTGKKLFINSITIDSSAANANISFADDTTTLIVLTEPLDNSTRTFVFTTPLKFVDSVKTNGSNVANASFTGWEE